MGVTQLSVGNGRTVPLYLDFSNAKFHSDGPYCLMDDGEMDLDGKGRRYYVLSNDDKDEFVLSIFVRDRDGFVELYIPKDGLSLVDPRTNEPIDEVSKFNKEEAVSVLEHNNVPLPPSLIAGLETHKTPSFTGPLFEEPDLSELGERPYDSKEIEEELLSDFDDREHQEAWLNPPQAEVFEKVEESPDELSKRDVLLPSGTRVTVPRDVTIGDLEKLTYAMPEEMGEVVLS
jgi:hypothetical protein